ncbi:hypothetical protein [Dactylosporangium sp. CA-139066]|uniref:hypothetical protein n=1 Tax=Dactylosporangium sp. CA-139066 TaxID=3239930 RepID=UPI003D920C5D
MNRRLIEARQEVMNAALYLAYANEALSGRLTASDSFEHDHAADRFDKALSAYVKAAKDGHGPECPDGRACPLECV